MPKVNIDQDEWWPVYTINNYWGRATEFTDEELAHVNSVFEAFEEMQQILKEKYQYGVKTI